MAAAPSKASVVFKLAPLDGYRIILEIDGRDIADVAAGQRGRLALSALLTLLIVPPMLTLVVGPLEARAQRRAAHAAGEMPAE